MLKVKKVKNKTAGINSNYCTLRLPSTHRDEFFVAEKIEKVFVFLKLFLFFLFPASYPKSKAVYFASCTFSEPIGLPQFNLKTG